MQKRTLFVFALALVLGFQNCGGDLSGGGGESKQSSHLTVEGDGGAGDGGGDDAVISVGGSIPGATGTAPTMPPTSPGPVPPVVLPSAGSAARVWVVRADGGSVQRPDSGGRSLGDEVNLLASAGVRVYATNKFLSLTGSSDISQALAVMNGLLVDDAQVAKLLGAGFARATSRQLAAVSCSGKETMMIFGQSNSANAGAVADTQVLAGAYMFHDGYCFPARDPLLGATIHNGGGSIGMRLLRKYRAANPGKEVVVFAFGYGGSSVQEWASGVHSSRLSAALSRARAAGLDVTKIFWHQGETDTVQRTSEALYLSAFSQVRGAVRAGGFSAPIYVAIASSMAYRPLWVSKAVQSAQYRAIESFADVELGGVSDYLELADRAPDALHLSSSGIEKLASQFFANAFQKSAPSTRDLIVAFYQTYLNRTPAASEQDYWLGKITATHSIGDVRLDIADSDEGFVRDLYRSSANRLASQSEYDYWIAHVRSDGRTKVAADFKTAVHDGTLGGTFDTSLFQLVDLGTIYNDIGLTRVIQPRLDRWRFDFANGAWVLQ